VRGPPRSATRHERGRATSHPGVEVPRRRRVDYQAASGHHRPHGPRHRPDDERPHHPRPGSTTAIIDALDQLRFEDPADGAASMRARYRGEHARWDPVTPARADLDDLAVDRVANDGKDVSLRPAEQHAALQRLAGQYPDIEIGRRLGMSARTVLRHRASQGLPACRPVPAKAPPDDHRLRPPPRASITPG